MPTTWYFHTSLIYEWGLTLILLTWRIWWAPNNASKWKMGFKSAFKVLNMLRLQICTVRPKRFRTDSFKNRRPIPSFIQNKLHWHIYRLLRGGTVSEKLPKIPLFGPSLIHQLRPIGSQQHPQSGVPLTSFSTWETKNSLAQTNLDSTRGDKVS